MNADRGEESSSHTEHHIYIKIEFCHFGLIHEKKKHLYLCVFQIDFQMMRKNERAHFFSPKEQEMILKLYEEEREILTAKSNTTSASKLREEAWQRIADKINT